MPSWNRIARGAILLICAGVVVHYAHALFGFARAGQYDFVDTWLMDGLLLCAAGIAAVGAWRAEPGRRIGPAMLVPAIASYALGFVFYHLFLVGASTTFPTVSDVLWLAFYPAAATTFILHLRREVGPRGWVWLDGAVNALALVGVGWAFVVAPVVAAAVDSKTYTLGGASYMVADLVLLGLLVAGATAQRFRLSRASWVFALGIALLAVTDIDYAWQISAGIDGTGTVLDPMWVTAMTLVGASNLLRRPPARRAASDPDSAMAASIPPVVALVSLAAILLATDSRAATALVLTSIALVCVRLVSSLHSNGRLLRAVSRAERTYRELVDTSQDVIWTVDTQGRMVFSNPAAEQLFGYSPEEMIGRPFALLLPGGVRAGDLEAYREVLAGSGLSQHQTQVVRKDGTERTVLINATPRRDAAGAVIGMTGTATDISARVETEQERERLQARAGEVERLEALGRLVGGIAHDYNNLTAVILNYAAFVRDEVESEAVRADVAEIQIAAGRAADLTRQLLIFSSHHQQLDLTVVDANEAIEQMGALLRRTIGEDIDLQLVTASEPARVELGPGQLDQVLMNLALNARDALPAGGRLTFAVELGDREPSGERSVKITARDTGSGIPPEHLTRLFEPFFTTKATGTGLGLATVHGIVRHAGGDVAVESEPGRGTTFTVELPEAPQGDDPPAEGPPRGDRDSHDATILIVEDEPGIRRVADRILTAAGYRTMCAANGAEAIAIAEHHEFDLLLTDVIMPGITGVDCARAVESLHPGIAVLLMSGYTDDVISRSTFGDPAPALLQKPFSAAQLESAVRQQLLAKLVA